ncbi:MAG: PQQ-binding-like beta-propeller repeat protein [Acidobacteria bacterium]|nr:PQQ-binding-like beta-propeller repeat protein [Acidobacteriota bacterium]
MSRRPIQRFVRAGMVAVAAALLHAQGPGEWTTSGFDAQRSGWLRADGRLTKDAVRKGEFAFLWKMKVENANRQLNSLTPPVLLDRLIGYRGFKALAFFGGSDDRVFSVDTDLGRPYWTTILNYAAATGGRPPSSWECPGGLVAMPGRRTPLAPPAGRAGGGPSTGSGQAGGRGGVRNASAVGEPGKGAAVLSQPPPQRGGDSGRGAEGRGGQPGRGGQEGRGAQGRGRGPAAIGFGGVDPLFALGSDGYIHSLYVSNGGHMEPPVPFLPPDTKASAVTWIDGVVYTTTSGECGGVPNAVWAMDLTVPASERKSLSWKTGGANIAGASGLAFGTNGTLYVALGKTAAKSNSSHADAIVALDHDTLQPKDWFTVTGADFNATPVVIRHKDRDLIAATANDGCLYLLDAASLGGHDHKTPLAVSGTFTSVGAGFGLATFENQGTRWILATASGASGDVTFTANGLAPNGRLVAFKVVDDGGTLSLAAGWQSRDLSSPLAPIVVNDMVVAVSSGEYRGTPASLSAAQRAQRSRPAILYLLDAASGKTLWTSGTTITSFARAGLSAGGGQVYVVTYDNHLYAFGIPMEH